MAGPNQSRTTSPNPDRLERVPPQDLEAEKSLLGSIILERNVMPDVLQVLGPSGKERFYRNDHRALYDVLVTMYDTSQPIDTVTLKEELQRRGLLEETGGVDYIVELVESVPSAANAEHYARIVRDKALLRELIRAGGEMMELAYGHAEPARDILDEAERLIFDVAGQRVSTRVDQLRDLLKEVYESLSTGDGDYVSGLATGFYQLDELTSGLQDGEMIVLAARPSMGKTALGLNIAEHIAVQEGKPVAFFSMEQSAMQVAQRILCGRAALDSQRLRKRQLTENDIHHLGMVCEELRDAQLLIDDTAGMTPLELRSKVRRLNHEHELGAVFIDYLQLMYLGKRADSRQQEVSEISRGIKALARELNIPIVVIAQLNRAAEGRTGNRPRMSDLRESGAIEQDADVILLLHREDYYNQDKPEYEPTNTAEVIIAKQRNGPTGVVELHWDGRMTRFTNHSVRPEPMPTDVVGYADAGPDAAPF